MYKVTLIMLNYLMLTANKVLDSVCTSSFWWAKSILKKEV